MEPHSTKMRVLRLWLVQHRQALRRRRHRALQPRRLLRQCKFPVTRSCSWVVRFGDALALPGPFDARRVPRRIRPPQRRIRPPQRHPLRRLHRHPLLAGLAAWQSLSRLCRRMRRGSCRGSACSSVRQLRQAAAHPLVSGLLGAWGPAQQATSRIALGHHSCRFQDQVR